jgi:hypothetical protein
MYADHLLRPWLTAMLAQHPTVRIFDAHTHVGQNDPSGFSATLAELEGSLRACEGRAVVFPLAEPEGYEDAWSPSPASPPRTGPTSCWSPPSQRVPGG